MGNKRSLSARRKAGKTDVRSSKNSSQMTDERMATSPSTSSLDVLPEMGRGQRQRKPRTDIFIPEFEDTVEEDEEDPGATVYNRILFRVWWLTFIDKGPKSDYSEIEEKEKDTSEDEDEEMESEPHIEEVIVKPKKGRGRPPKQMSVQVNEPKCMYSNFIPI